MNREEIEVYLAEYVDGTLPEAARAAVDRALLKDPALAAEVELSRFGQRAASQLAPPSMPFELRGHILRATVERPSLLGRVGDWFRAMPAAVYAAAMVAIIAGVVALVEVETLTHGGIKAVEPVAKVTTAVKGVSMVKERPAAPPVVAMQSPAGPEFAKREQGVAPPSKPALDVADGDESGERLASKDKSAKADVLEEKSDTVKTIEGAAMGGETVVAGASGMGRSAERAPPPAMEPVGRSGGEKAPDEAPSKETASAGDFRRQPAPAPMEELALPVTVVTTGGGYIEDGWDVAPYIVDDLSVENELEESALDETRNGPTLLGGVATGAVMPASPAASPASLDSMRTRRSAPARERSGGFAAKKMEKSPLADAESESPGAAALQIHVVARYGGAYSGWTRPGRVVIRDEATWREYWRTINAVVADAPPAPVVDFRRQIVIGVGLGSRPTGGFGVDIVSVRAEGDRVLVRVSAFEPEPGQLVTQAFTQPYALVVVDIGESISPEDIRVGFER